MCLRKCNNYANHLLPRLSASVSGEKKLLDGYNFTLIELIIFNVIVLIALVEMSIGFFIISFIGLTNRKEIVEVLFEYL